MTTAYTQTDIQENTDSLHGGAAEAPARQYTPAQKVKNNYFDGLAVTGGHRVVFFIIMLAYFFEQMDNWNFGFIAPALIASKYMTMQQIGFINSCYFIAMTTGGVLGGVISDIIGRRKTFLISIAIFSVSSVVNGLTDNFYLFTFARAMTGFGVFCLMVTSQTYIAEMAPSESRGKWQGLVAAVGFAAVPVIAAVCRFIIPMYEDAWRLIFYFGGLGIIGFIFGIKYLKESPRWLVSKHRLEEAEAVVQSITNRAIDLSDAAKSIPQRERFIDVLGGMFQPQYIKRTLLLMLGFMISVPAQFTFTVFAPTLIKSQGFTLEDTLTVSMVISIGVPVGCYLSSLVSDRGGRKIPLVCLFAAGSVLSLIFGHLTGYLSIMLVGFALSVSNMASSFILFSYAAESYPTKMRNTSTGFHNGLARLSVSAMMSIIPLISASHGFSGVFNTAASLLIIPVLPILLWGMRTGGKSLEEIS